MIEISKEEIADKMFFIREEDSNQPIAVIKVGDLMKCERPKGEWIMQLHTLEGEFYTCSICGRPIRVSSYVEDNETLKDYPFCHCGADMRKGEEE